VKIVTGETIWSKINEIPTQYEYLKDDITCDVLIIGAGVTGALCSYYFSKENIKTVLVDQNIIGYGSTRGCTAILQYEIDKDLHKLESQLGHYNAIESFKEMQNGLVDIDTIIPELDDDCDYETKDCLYYTDKNKYIKDLKLEYIAREKAGFDVELIDSNNNDNRFSFDIKLGIYSNNLARQLDPYRFTHSLIRKAKNNGARVYENVKVLTIDNSEDYVKVTTNKEKTITAKKIIIATGYKAKNFFKKKILYLSRSFNIVTEPLDTTPGWYNKCIIRDNLDPYCYVRSTKDNRMIFGGEDVTIHQFTKKLKDLNQDDKLSNDKYDILYDKLLSQFPKISDPQIEYSFSGYFGETKDGLPYIGEHPDYRNYYFCLGYGSNGIVNAALGAKILKDLYLGKYSSMLYLFRFNR